MRDAALSRCRRLRAWLLLLLVLSLLLQACGFASVAYQPVDNVSLPTSSNLVNSRPPNALSGFASTTSAVWAPSSLGARIVLLRPPTIEVGRRRIARLHVKVGTAPAAVTTTYRLFVNGLAIAIGMGRASAPSEIPKSAADYVYDAFEVPSSALGGAKLALALQCFHEDGKESAWALLEARAFDDFNRTIGVYGTGEHWFAYDARWIFRRGRPNFGGGSLQSRLYNEDIDASEFKPVVGWRSLDFVPKIAEEQREGGWLAAEPRSLGMGPTPKRTPPFFVKAKIAPLVVKQTRPDHWFVDFGVKRAAGAQLIVPAATSALWGGRRTRIELRMSEHLSQDDAHAINWPGVLTSFLRGVPTYVSILTLADGESEFELHGYPGNWRYAELAILRPWLSRSGWRPPVVGGVFSLTQWALVRELT